MRLLISTVACMLVFCGAFASEDPPLVKLTIKPAVHGSITILETKGSSNSKDYHDFKEGTLTYPMYTEVRLKATAEGPPYQFLCWNSPQVKAESEIWIYLEEDTEVEACFFDDPRITNPVIEGYIRKLANNQSEALTDEDFAKITELRLGDSANIETLGDLRRCTNLEILCLPYAGVKDISALAGLENLKHLDLSQNQVADVVPLGALKELEYLNLSNNPIHNFTVLSLLTTLKVLFLDHTGMDSLQVLENLNNLTFLSVRNNSIHSLESFMDSASLYKGSQLWLDGNPLDEKALCDHIPLIRSWDVEVSHESSCNR